MDYSGSGAERGRGGTGAGDVGFSGGAAPAVNGGGGDAQAIEQGIASVMNQADFNALNQITATNPYGSQGIFTTAFGIDPSLIDYSNLMSQQQRESLMNLAYDRYANPYAQTNVLGGETMADPEVGQVRYGLSPGDITQYGTVTSVPTAKSQSRLMMESMPSLIGFLSKMAPEPSINMIEGPGKPGVPTSKEGMEKYNESKMYEPPSFIDYILGGFTK